MASILTRHQGMNIIGQGGKIILFTLPSLTAAILMNLYYPTAAAMPESLHWIQPAGYIWLVPGVILWAIAVSQLLVGFPAGKLITTGAYGVVRNPIYASVILFILPATAILTLTWVYLVPAAFLYIGVTLFIGVEERQLLIAFGEAYQKYCKTHHRLIPFIKS